MMYEIDIILLLLSIVVSFVFYRRYSLSNDTTLLYWSLGFGFYSFSLLLSLLLVMGFFKSSFDLNLLAQFFRQSFVALLFISILYSVMILITKDKLVKWLLLVLFLIQELVFVYFDFFVQNVRSADLVHILFVSIPFNVVFSGLFLYYYFVSERKFALYQAIGWGSYSFIVLLSYTNQLGGMSKFLNFLPMGLITFGMIDYLKYPTDVAFFTVNPYVSKIDSTYSGKLKKGVSYLFNETKLVKSINQFNSYVDNKYSGLIFTRTNPDFAKQKYGLKNSNVVWITDVDNSFKYITSNNLEQIIFVVDNFLKNSKKSVIMFDGFDYLMISNGFDKILHVLELIKDKVSDTDSRLILSINSNTLDSKHYNILKREFELI